MSVLNNRPFKMKQLAGDQAGYTVLELLAVLIVAVILVVLIFWR